MKTCPKCQTNYDDNSLSFCLNDGTALLVTPEDNSTSEVETQVGTNFPNDSQTPPIYVDFGKNQTVASNTPPAPPHQQQDIAIGQIPPPPKNPVNFILLALLFLALGVIGGGGLVLFLGGFSTNTPTVQNNPVSNESVKEENTEKKKPKKTPTPEIKEQEPDEEDISESENDILDEPTELPTPEPKTCYLTDRGKGGGEVNVRRSCNIYNCEKDSSTKVRTFSNGIPVTKLGSTARSANFLWVKVEIYGNAYWVASSKISCS